MSASRSSEAPRDAHLIGEWARLLFATLENAGVRDVWVSPGSRSTPFVWAALHTLGLEVRSVVDERSAAFLALGHARSTGRPSALLCTSGTAAANYFPAVVEASLSHLPLVVLSADRPLDVQQAGAAQTIDQVKLYGEHARAFFDLGLPHAAPNALIGLRRQVAQAVAQALGPLPGPVHLNLRARKPLEPAAAANDAERTLSAQVSELIARPLARHAPVSGLANEAVLAAARTIAEAASGCLVLGPLPAFGHHLAEPVAELSRLTGFPIFAEASSQLRFALSQHEHSYPLFDWLLSAPEIARQLRPELLVCIGQTPTSSAFERWAAHVPRRIVLAEHAYPDALGTADLVASGALAPGLAALLTELRTQPGQPQADQRESDNPRSDSPRSDDPHSDDPRGNSALATDLTGKSPRRTPETSTNTYTSSYSTNTYTSSYSNAGPQRGAELRQTLAALHQRCAELVDDAVKAANARLADATSGARNVANASSGGGRTDASSGGGRALLAEGAAVRSVIESLPEGALLALGNSLPIRDVDAYVTTAARLRVASQRGANGIDGLVSGAIGSAIGSGAPTLLLIGDVSLFHDLGGLASAALVPTPLVIAVVDNAGGRIFDQLPVQQLYADKADVAELWLTPPGRDLAHAAKLFGLRYAAPSTPAEIQKATHAALSEPGVTLLHLRVEPDSAASMRRKILAALDEASGARS